MVEFLMDVDESASRRMKQARQLERAIARTERLLASPAAGRSPELRARWLKRLDAQRGNLIAICR